MKKKIIIALIVLAVLAGTGVLLYFFVFKDNNMKTEQASNLVTRMAIVAGAIEDFKDSPTFEDFSGIDSKNSIINSNELSSIVGIDFSNIEYEDGLEEEYKTLIIDYMNILKIKGLQRETLYEYSLDEGPMLIIFRTLGNEIVFVKKAVYEETESNPETTLIAFTSILYDTKYQQFEIINIKRETTDTTEKTTFERVKIGEKGFVSLETYTSTLESNYKKLSDVINKGTSTAKIIDFVDKESSSGKFTAGSDNNFQLSSYVQGAYKNFEDNLKESLEVINSDREATVIRNGKIMQSKNMSTEDANNLLIRMAITGKVIAEYEDAPTFKNFPATYEEKNIINFNEFESLDGLTLDKNDYSENILTVFKPIMLNFTDFTKLDKLDKNQIYNYGDNRIIITAVENELVFVRKPITEKNKETIFLTSIFYNAENKEFEMIEFTKVTTKDTVTTTLTKFKVSEKGVISRESYQSILNVKEEDIQKAIKEGTSSANIINVIDKKISTGSFAAGSQDNYLVSNYINKAYKTFEDRVADTINLIKSDKKAMEIKDGKIVAK